ncbi:queuosine precursor transporter [Halorubrum ruber]|uniref:Probable queuosine precursor transporter n=1 Tax=Halorubrum ruber TaxID=2982524 RepID=A0A8T8LJD4_9EURY|nr:queuosine precursor transporter [Halorubrum ruber]QUO47193.1 queuosine precursor transporter [Halorubrum ruber]
METEDTRAIFTAVFAGSIVLANVLAAKLTWIELPGLGGVAVPAGFVAFGVAYLASDLLVEYHGKEYAATVVNGTVVTLVIAYALVFLAIWMPSAPFYGGQDAFVSTLGGSASIILASVVALAFAQHLDVRLFANLKTRTGGRHRWLRNCGSTAVSQGVDTIVFITLGFAIFPALGLGGEPTWGWALASIVAGQYIVKLLVALIDTLPFYVVTEFVKQPV